MYVYSYLTNCYFLVIHVKRKQPLNKQSEAASACHYFLLTYNINYPNNNNNNQLS